MADETKASQPGAFQQTPGGPILTKRDLAASGAAANYAAETTPAVMRLRERERTDRNLLKAKAKNKNLGE